MVTIVDTRISVASVTDAVRSPRHGAILVFEGVGRETHAGKAVASLRYEAYVPMAERELAAIVAETQAKWPGASVAIAHRTGAVAIGEPSVVIAIGAPHRDAAYAASRYAIDELKRRAPIWKQEIYSDGTAWIANRDPA